MADTKGFGLVHMAAQNRFSISNNSASEINPNETYEQTFTRMEEVIL
jgi:hypothetical protein